MAYSKLHSSIVNSSLWTAPDSARLLFVTLLAMCDRDGMVYGSKSGFSRLANIDPNEADDAWEILMSPDPESSDRMRSPDHEGRRVEEVPGGFCLLNFAYYRGLRNDDDRREQNRVAQAKFKAKVSQGKPTSAEIIPSKERASVSESVSAKDGGQGEGLPFESTEFKEAWENFLQHRKEIKKPVTPTNARSQLKAFKKMGEERSIAAIEHTITKGWQGIAEPDQKHGKHSSTPRDCSRAAGTANAGTAHQYGP